MYVLLLHFITSGKPQIIFYLPSTFQNCHQKVPLPYRLFFLLQLEVTERTLCLISCVLISPCLLNIIWLILIWQGFKTDIESVILNGAAMSLYYSALIHSPWWHLGLLLSARFLSFWTACKIWVGSFVKISSMILLFLKVNILGGKKYFPSYSPSLLSLQVVILFTLYSKWPMYIVRQLLICMPKADSLHLVTI